jgi:Zn-finger nucleic acid-binding protein
MDCPRCHLSLRKDRYEGVEVDFCDACWGCWLDDGEFARILESRGLEFSADEKDVVLAMMTASKAGPRGQLLCPRCRSFMEQLRYDERVELLIDRCPQHGVWLDAGEIKKAQAVAEQSKAIQKLLIRKLKLAR